MPDSLHLFFTTALPQFKPEDASELLLVEDDSSESQEGVPIPSGQLEYVTTLVSNYADLSLLHLAVNQWWLDWAGVAARLELVADDRSEMAQDPITRLEKLQTPNSWSINTAFVAFRPQSRTARPERPPA